MKAFKTQNYCQVEFSDGSTFTSTENIDEIWEFIAAHQSNENAVKKHLMGKDVYQGKELLEKVENSSILTLRGNSVYMLGVSELSIPEDFVAKIIQAEEEDNKTELTKFKNFWTLVSLNPDSRVRNNLFWFIRKWDMQITESGLVIAYRNACVRDENKYTTKEARDIINSYYQEKYLNGNDPGNIQILIDGNSVNLDKAYNEILNGADSPIYTDMHSHSTEIRLGHPVTMPREKCDADQENSCSMGLHCGAKGWLKQNYFGEVGLMVLVDPSKVVAVPTIDNYGKMRTCEYFPVGIIDFDSEGEIIEPEYNLYNDVAYLKELRYEGDINNNDIDGYEITHTTSSREEMYNQILSRLNVTQ